MCVCVNKSHLLVGLLIVLVELESFVKLINVLFIVLLKHYKWWLDGTSNVRLIILVVLVILRPTRIIRVYFVNYAFCFHLTLTQWKNGKFTIYFTCVHKHTHTYIYISIYIFIIVFYQGFTFFLFMLNSYIYPLISRWKEEERNHNLFFIFFWLFYFFYVSTIVLKWG